MALGVGFANDEYDEMSIEDYYEEELNDAPIGAGGFVEDICYERAIERYLENKDTTPPKRRDRDLCNLRRRKEEITMTRYKNTYILLDNEDGEIIIKSYEDHEDNLMMRAISKHICFSDCDDTFTIIGMYYHGREIEYDGWRPGMVMSYSYKATGDLAWEESFPQYDH